MPAASSVSLSGAAASVPEARRFVRSTLQAWELEDAADAAVLVVSELATNVVLHARSAFSVRLEALADGSVRLEVADASPRHPDARARSLGAATGRGLVIVAELASSWGVRPDGDGKAVWAVLEVAEAGGASVR